MKMHKNCCHQSCSFWLRYMHQIVCRLGLCPRPTGGAYIAPPDSLAGLGVGTTGNGKEGGEGKRREGRDGRGGRPGMPKSRVGKPRRLLSRSRYYPDLPHPSDTHSTAKLEGAFPIYLEFIATFLTRVAACFGIVRGITALVSRISLYFVKINKHRIVNNRQITKFTSGPQEKCLYVFYAIGTQNSRHCHSGLPIFTIFGYRIATLKNTPIRLVLGVF